MKIPNLPFKSLQWLIVLLSLLVQSRAADSLFAPEPKPEAIEGSAGTPLIADASGDQASSLFRAPGAPASSSPTQGTTSNAIANPKETNASASVVTNSASVTAVPVDKPKETADATAAESLPAASPATPEIPVDAPPNLDQPADKMAASAVAPPSENVTLNLINRLVQRGILTKEDAGDLIRQAKEDAQTAVQQAQATQQAAQQAAAAQQMAVESAAPPASDDAVSVSYVPEIVKAEMRDEIKRDVLAAAQSEGWATPNYPSWISNFRPFMDLRTRFQGDYYPNNSSYTDTNVSVLENANLLNFNVINTGNPLNVASIPGVGGAYGLTGIYPNSIFAIPYGQPGAPPLPPSGQQYPAYYQQQTPGVTPPTVNNTQQRDRVRIRFRFGADMNLGDNFTSGFRIGTGQNGNPVSENQTLGAPGSTGGQGGNFSSYAIWLDRAFLKYELGDNPDRMAAITVGRFDNPFYTPTTIMWANDIGFDGVAAQARYKVFKGFTPFVSGGIFPVFNTDLNFASTAQPKFSSYDKYLFAGQGGIDWKITKDLNLKGALGYYYFQNVQGQVSAPGITPTAQAQMSTDSSRPSFAQTGNSYIEIRNIQAVSAYPATNPIPDSKQRAGSYIPTPRTNYATANYIYNPDYQHYVNTGGTFGVQPTNNPTTGFTNSGLGYVPPPQYQNQYQYFGLATPFHVLSANARLEYRHFEPFVVSISGEWDKNLAFNQQNIMNNGPTPGPDNNYNYALTPGPINNWQNGLYGTTFQGGDTAWILQAKIGKGALQKRWDWDFGFSYRYVESDSVIDGFCDSDFGGPLSGTNLKGWAIGGNLALSKNVFLGARWFNATTIAGTPINLNTLQLDVNARF